MNKWILNLIVNWYAFPYRTVSRDFVTQHGERSGGWHG